MYNLTYFSYQDETYIGKLYLGIIHAIYYFVLKLIGLLHNFKLLYALVCQWPIYTPTNSF